MCVAQPDSAPPANRYPVLIAVNGHGGSAWATLSPDDELRRARTAWTETPQRVLHQLHYDVHHFHIGAPAPALPTAPGVRAPVEIAPDANFSPSSQTDASTTLAGADLFGVIDSLLP